MTAMIDVGPQPFPFKMQKRITSQMVAGAPINTMAITEERMQERLKAEITGELRNKFDLEFNKLSETQQKEVVKLKERKVKIELEMDLKNMVTHENMMGKLP